MSKVVLLPKLIGAASFRSFRCLWMLEEIGIPYEHVQAMPQDEQVRKLNPLGKIPVLIDDGFTMYESTAINTYLGDKYRDKIRNSSLVVPPVGTPARGFYEQTMSVLNAELDSQALWIHRKHEALGDFFTHIPDAVAHAKKYYSKVNRTLIQQLKKNGPYLLGNAFTACDIVYVHCLDWSASIGWDAKYKEDPTIIDYLSKCKSRPAYVKVKAIRDEEQKRSKM